MPSLGTPYGSDQWARYYQTAEGHAGRAPGLQHQARRAAAGRGTFWDEADRLKTLMGSISNVTGTDGDGGAGGPTPVYGDLEGANAEEFGRAKDRVGQLTRGSLRGLRESLAGQGRLGGGMQAVGEADILGQGAGQLADTVREQAIQGVNRRRHTMDQNFAAQREAAQRRADAARQNASSQQQNYLSALQALMRSHEGMY